MPMGLATITITITIAIAIAVYRTRRNVTIYDNIITATVVFYQVATVINTIFTAIFFRAYTITIITINTVTIIGARDRLHIYLSRLLLLFQL